MYMSRLAALKEFEFMKALRAAGFPVPEPVGQNRHTVIMSLIDAFPMRQISKVGDAAPLYAELLSLIVRFAQHGLIHGDFNEFNILVEERQEGEDKVNLIPTIIDFPQMVSIDHANAEYYFDRDVACIKRFFERRFGFTSDEPGPFFKDVIKTITKRLDVDVQASGFSKKMAKELELYMKEHGIDGDDAGDANDAEGREVEEDDADVHDEDNDEQDTANFDTEDNEDGGIALDGGPVGQDVTTTTTTTATTGDDVPATGAKSSLAEQMTILDIRDNDPLPDLSEIKQPPAEPSITTKAAKKKAGWAI